MMTNQVNIGNYYIAGTVGIGSHKMNVPAEDIDKINGRCTYK